MLLTHEEYNRKITELDFPYWTEGRKYRWDYIGPVINILRSINAKNTLEMGCMRLPLNSTSTLIELDKSDLVTESGIIHDLNMIPYPFKSKQFDCAIALQVFEHLTYQQGAFLELRRISKHIILSFPYLWKSGDSMHVGINDKKIMRWTCGVHPDKKIIIQFSKGRKNRAIYYWRVR